MKPVIFTIGHSNYSIQTLLEKLAENSIQTLIDVRSKPYSRFCSQFNKTSLANSIQEFGIKYEWRGNNLGGYGENVKFPETIQELADRSKSETICLMCMERDPAKCHRGQTLAPELVSLGIKVKHILYD